ncbi:MAG: hypothetical protein WBA57_12190 [Elainellaceae cyanobacterium]
MSSRFNQPLDRVALGLMAILAVAIAILVLFGHRAAPKVRSFSWQDRQVGAEDTAFLLTFTRPMNEQSVEESLTLSAIVSETEREIIPGKVSWAGRRMAYTLDEPAPYGYEFELDLEGAWDRFSDSGDAVLIQPFQGTFRTRDRAFLYLGVEGEEEGRLVLYNLTEKERHILTPETLVVMDYEPYPKGDRVLFSATDRASQEQGLLNQQIYAVSTGIRVDSSPESLGYAVNTVEPPSLDDMPAEGEVKLILDSDQYQNLRFDLAPSGEFVVVYRVNRQNPAEFGLWMVRPGESPYPIEAEPGGDFIIAPDSQTLAYLQGQGLSILSLAPESEAAGDNTATPETGDRPSESLDFLPQYGMVLGFAQDGSAAATVKFNAVLGDPTQSLYLVSSQGDETELLETDGSILKAVFDPTETYLYALVTKLLPGEIYAEQPYLVAINLETTNTTELLLLPLQQDIHMSLAPDGLGILFDQVKSFTDEANSSILRGNDGQPIATSQLWFFPILQDAEGNLIVAEPDPIPVAGLRPTWLP